MIKQLNIDEIKNCEYNILKYIDSVCKKEGINYTLDQGTLLGAVRHDGFIPWDDDIDIAMLRSDYDKLMSYIKKDNSRYKVSDHLIDPNSILPFAKIYDSETIIRWHCKYPKEQKYGIWVDVFPIDAVPENPVALKVHQIKLRILKSMYEHVRNQYIEKRTFKTLVAQRIASIHSMDYYLTKLDKLARKYNNQNNAKLTMSVFGITNNYHTINKKVFTDITTHQFEDSVYPIPRQYDSYLKMLYGNYMELPPVEKRKNLHIIDAFYTKE